MILKRPDRKANELFLWIGTAGLAAALALASSFALWNELNGTKEGTLLMVAIIVLGFGVGLIGVSARGRLVRTFALTFAVAFVLGFFAGSPALAHLIS